jgi:phosphoglycolate phosphatase
MAPSTPRVRRLILFDVDGTLCSTKGLGAEAMSEAATDIYGVPRPFDRYAMAGKTDLQIFREALRIAGIPDDRIERDLPRALALHAARLEAAFRNRGRGHLHPGVQPLLDRLGADPRWGVGLLTGNTRDGARIKLSYFGIWERFAFGAFGDDAEDRNALPAVALRRARETLGVEIAPPDAYVVGDTTRDIACARAGGMRAVAVATGGNAHAILAAANPDLLFSNLENVDHVMRKLEA